jgi:polysaccharide chain length determinant protein (PEP-CTERM system associated)
LVLTARQRPDGAGTFEPRRRESDYAMEQLKTQILEAARAMWRRRWIGVLVGWLVAVLGAIGVSMLHDRFEASARVYVDTKSVLRPLMRDLAVEPDLDQTVGLLARTLITRPNAEVLVDKSFPEARRAPPEEREQMVERLMGDIRIASSGRDNVFNFSYRGTDPETTRLVVANLVSLFLASDTGNKQRDAQAARDFIDEQIKNYESRLAEAENRLKEFKLRNLGVTDTSGKDYFARMTALTEEMSKLSVELRAAEQSRDALRRELGGETESLVPETLASSSVQTSEYDARLEAQRKQLDELLRRYTDQHPDVVATKHLIASLEADREREIDARRKAAAGKPAAPLPGGANSTQQQIRLALAQSEAEVASLRVRAGDMQARLAQLRASATRVPQIEAEMAQLNRDYEVIKGAYQTMVSRREKAALSEDVDATRSAQFQIIDPPRTEPKPVFPNRPVLSVLVVFLALVAGIAATFLAANLSPTFDSARLLGEATHRKVLGSVSMVMNATTLRQARVEKMGFGSALGSLLVAAGVWVAWVAMQSRH